MISELLEGRPLKHPLHPALVHFPIGLFVFSFLLDLGSFLDEATNLAKGSYYAIWAGLIAALIAAVPGLADRAQIRDDHPAKERATTHMVLNFIVVGAYAISLTLRAGHLESHGTPFLPFIFSLAGLAILSYSGYLGGSLVYRDGIGVGRHRRKTATPEITLSVPSTGAPRRFVPVADVDCLSDGETLRVEVNGNLATIVRLGSEFFAFQEFCTHRYGPLSEGSFKDGKVECPWHRSCFEVRTGKVIKGPAKANLKTYEVAVRDHTIYIRAPETVRDQQRQLELSAAVPG